MLAMPQVLPHLKEASKGVSAATCVSECGECGGRFLGPGNLVVPIQINTSAPAERTRGDEKLTANFPLPWEIYCFSFKYWSFSNKVFLKIKSLKKKKKKKISQTKMDEKEQIPN